MDCRITQSEIAKCATSLQKNSLLCCWCFIQKEPRLSRQLLFRLPCYLIGEREGVKEERVRRKERGEKLRRRRDLERSLYLQLYFYPGHSLPLRPAVSQSNLTPSSNETTNRHIDRGRVPIRHWVIETREKECH